MMGERVEDVYLALVRPARYVVCEYYYGNGIKEFVQIVGYAGDLKEAAEMATKANRLRLLADDDKHYLAEIEPNTGI